MHRLLFGSHEAEQNLSKSLVNFVSASSSKINRNSSGLSGIARIFPSSAGNPREFAIALRSTKRFTVSVFDEARS